MKVVSILCLLGSFITAIFCSTKIEQIKSYGLLGKIYASDEMQILDALFGASIIIGIISFIVFIVCCVISEQSNN